MSDQETPVEETSTTSTLTGPDGQPWDPDRAMSTIKSLREREQELEPTAKQFQRLSEGEDPDTFKELAEKYGYQLADDEDDEVDLSAWEDPNAADIAATRQELEEIKQWKQQQEAHQAISAFESTVGSLSKKADVELDEIEVQAILQDVLSKSDKLTDKAIGDAFTRAVERQKAYEAKIIERHLNAKKAPRGPVSGESASAVPDLKTREDIVKHIQSRLQDE